MLPRCCGFFPRLAGKPAGYLYNQLLAFRSGWTLENHTITALAGGIVFFSVLAFVYALFRRGQLLRGTTPPVAGPAYIAAIAVLAMAAAAVGCGALVMSGLQQVH